MRGRLLRLWVELAPFIGAGAPAVEFLAGGGDLEFLGADLEPQTRGDFVLELHDLFTFEFDDPLAVLADDVAMIGVRCVIWIVKLMILAEIHFAEQAALDQEWEGAIDGGARDRGVDPTRPIEQLLRSEMLFCAEDGVEDGLALARHAEIFRPEELDELCF